MDGPFISDLLPINNAVIQQQKKSLYLVQITPASITKTTDTSYPINLVGNR
jgi:hypothetical protein